MSVSLILALDGGAERSLRCLAALASVPDDPPHEVVVVDDASADLAPVLARIEGGARSSASSAAPAWPPRCAPGSRGPRATSSSCCAAPSRSSRAS